MAEQTKFVKAVMDYFSEDGRKMTAVEYKELSRKDKEELREMFISELGMDIAPLPPEKT